MSDIPELENLFLDLNLDAIRLQWSNGRNHAVYMPTMKTKFSVALALKQLSDVVAEDDELKDS